MNTNIKYLLYSGILFLNSFPVSSQEKQYTNDKFVIVLDVQQYWTENTLSKEAAGEMILSINSLVERTDPAKVIYIKSVARAASLSFKGVKIDTLPGQDFDKNLRIVSDLVFMKTEGDAFTSQELVSYLERNKAKEIIITGLLAEKCVTKTALGGIARKYDIYLIPEAIGAKSEKSKIKTLKKLTNAGVRIYDQDPVL